YRDFAPVAWGTLLGRQPDETKVAEIDAGATEDFDIRLGSAFTKLITFPWVETERKDDRKDDSEAQMQANPMLVWCLKLAQEAGWKRSRGYFAWCKREKTAGSTEERLRIAWRPEFLGQVGLPDLQALGYATLADRCSLYGIGERGRAGKGGQ